MFTLSNDNSPTISWVTKDLPHTSYAFAVYIKGIITTTCAWITFCLFHQQLHGG
jgi:hypothetical protein